MEKIKKGIFKDITLLYVEDDIMTLEEVEHFLSKYVKKLVVAKNGEEGLELYKEHKPDIVITDIQMPKMTGLEMSSEILNIDKNVPIIVTTAYSDSEYLIDSLSIGIEKYILKPINLYELLVLIQKSLNLDCTKIEKYEEYIQFLVDCNTTFMFVVNDNKVEHANKELLSLVRNYSRNSVSNDLEEFTKYFEFENTKEIKSLSSLINQNSSKDYVVKLKNLEKKEGFVSRKFIVNYRYFESMNKGVFTFKEIKNIVLNEIFDIARELIENISDKSKDELVSKLSKIVDLTK